MREPVARNYLLKHTFDSSNHSMHDNKTNIAWSLYSSETKGERDAFREHCADFAQQQQEGEREKRKQQLPLQKRKYGCVSQPAGSAQASGSSRDRRVTQPAGCETATGCDQQLVQKVLQTLMDYVTKIVAPAHHENLEPLPALDKQWKQEMRSKYFGSILNSLQRAYSKLLHHTFENELPSEIAGSVQNLAAAILWKLSFKSEEAAEEGKELMVQMLEHLQVEFKCEKILKLLERATATVEIEKGNASKRVKTCHDNLQEMCKRSPKSEETVDEGIRQVFQAMAEILESAAEICRNCERRY